jgi:DNA-directed RNA polymerase specialized sigma24 family protein
MAFEVFPWNEWIEQLVSGDEAPFFDGLRRSVYGYRFLRGKRAQELRRDYGDDLREDIVQAVALKTLRVMDAWAGRRSDEEIAASIMTIIRHEVTDCYRRRLREKTLFLAEDSNSSGDRPSALESAYRNAPDLKPTPEAEFMLKQFIRSIYALVTPRQAFILSNYRGFGLGTLSARALADECGISVKGIEKHVTIIKQKIRKFALLSGYLEGDMAEVAAEPHRAGARR